MALYGNFGTLRGRIKGGRKSVIVHLKRRDGFKTLQPIARPRNSARLAELIGLLIGDGHLSEYQVSITTNSETDIAHARFAKRLIENLFRVTASLKKKKRENAVVVLASSKKLVRFLNRKGMPIGNKIEKHLQIPAWVQRNPSYQKAFLRGLFDTDGCIYVDTHRNGDKIYRHLGWTITSYADKLIIGLIDILKRLGFSPTWRNSQKSVYLRRRIEIDRYFQKVSTHNPKHRNRYKEGCAEW